MASKHLKNLCCIPARVTSSIFAARFKPVIVTRVPPHAEPDVGDIELRIATWVTVCSQNEKLHKSLLAYKRVSCYIQKLPIDTEGITVMACAFRTPDVYPEEANARVSVFNCITAKLPPAL